jgi:4a-hydroxytetrahydrobiopterin dehydratase
MDTLTKEQINKNLKGLPEWYIEKQKLVRTFYFNDFNQAIAFLNQIAVLSEEQNHHPILISKYNTVEVKLYTLDVKGISQKDFALAEAIDQLL